MLWRIGEEDLVSRLPRKGYFIFTTHDFDEQTLGLEYNGLGTCQGPLNVTLLVEVTMSFRS